MTANKRIFLNIVATYGRSLYALVIGLFCGRWTLMALGEVDYGLLGLIGGLIAFVGFFNNLLASAVGRFYAISVGEAKKNDNAARGLEECRAWFNTAVSIHSAVPVFLVALGYPLGIWAVENFLTIPPDRICDCVWVWRFTCLSCFVGMISVPFQAMYYAKQEIAELTIYSFCTTTFNACFLYYMITHPQVWLFGMACWMCVLSVVSQVIIVVRAAIKYPECRLLRAYLWDRLRIYEVGKFAYARFMAEFSGLLSVQLKSIMVNKFMGPRFNASMTVGNTVSTHAMTLAGAVEGAIWPALANKAGEGDLAAVKKLSFVACRVNAFVVLIFAIPLSLEIHEVLRLWLITPPAYAAELCVAILMGSALVKTTDGYWMSILGVGRGVIQYSHRICLCGLSEIVVAFLLFVSGMGMWSICIAMYANYGLGVVIRLVSGREFNGYEIGYWLRRVFVPLALAAASSFVVGLLPRLFLSASFSRVVLTTVVCEMALFTVALILVFERTERDYLIQAVRTKFHLAKKGVC